MAIYPHPEVGSTINHGTRIECCFPAHDDFLSNFDGRIIYGIGTCKIKDYLYNFPSFQANASQANILIYLQSICLYSMGYGLYIPLLHTFQYDDPYGKWSKKAHLYDTPTLLHLVSYTSGYRIIYKMAHIAGHPTLNDGIHQGDTMPEQTPEMSLM